jgi:hypothetical protein
MKPILAGLVVMLTVMLCGRATAYSQEKAIFYQERTSSEQGTADRGSVVWSVVQVAPGGNNPPEPAIRGEVTVQALGLRIIVTVRRNGDNALPASHLIGLIFLAPEGFDGSNIETILRFAVKDTEEAAGNPIFAVPAKVADGYFVLALENKPAVIATNLAMLSQKGWIDVPVVYTSGRRALLALDKGSTGYRLFSEVIGEWKRKAKFPVEQSLVRQVADDSPQKPRGIWAVQIASEPTEGLARGQYESLLRRFPNILNGLDAFISRGSVTTDVAHRIRLVAENKEHALLLCDELKKAGGNCFVVLATHGSFRKSLRGAATSVAASDTPPVPAADLYEGEMHNGTPHGKGVMSFREGDKYVGDLRHGRPDGQGVLDTAEGDRFEGEFKDGRPHGRGALTTAEGFRYEGTWSEGREVAVQRVGVRKPARPAKVAGIETALPKPEQLERRLPEVLPSRRVGFEEDIRSQEHARIRLMQEWLNWRGYGAGDVDGRVGPRTFTAIRAYARDHGISLDAMGARLLIDHVTGQHPDTRPRFWETDRNACQAWSAYPARAKLKLKWTGTCVDGYAHGHGKLMQEFIFHGEKAWVQFDGFLAKGKHSGNGELTWHGKRVAKGQKYVGNFAEGSLNGKGEMRFSDGRYFKGYWKNDRYEGSGVYGSPTFGRLEGMFSNGLPNGYGRHFDTTGRLRMEGNFSNGCLKVGTKWVYVLTTREKCGF